jgi:prophage antirepressor-like protein
MHGDSDALVIDPRRLEAEEQRWVARQVRKQRRAAGCGSKYVPHQGKREQARRMVHEARQG